MSGQTIDHVIFNWLTQLTLKPGIGAGWIRTVRTQRNIQGKQLAEKMRVSPARISVLERDEQRGAVSLKMMQKAADALDCTFVYALIPKSAQQAKPRIRLDSEYMRGDKDHQATELQQQYASGQPKTTAE
jgi:predicted DNA-binding mobile mystery protein A